MWKLPEMLRKGSLDLQKQEKRLKKMSLTRRRIQADISYESILNHFRCFERYDGLEADPRSSALMEVTQGLHAPLHWPIRRRLAAGWKVNWLISWRSPRYGWWPPVFAVATWSSVKYLKNVKVLFEVPRLFAESLFYFRLKCNSRSKRVGNFVAHCVCGSYTELITLEVKLNTNRAAQQSRVSLIWFQFHANLLKYFVPIKKVFKNEIRWFGEWNEVSLWTEQYRYHIINACNERRIVCQCLIKVRFSVDELINLTSCRRTKRSNRLKTALRCLINPADFGPDQYLSAHERMQVKKQTDDSLARNETQTAVAGFKVHTLTSPGCHLWVCRNR